MLLAAVLLLCIYITSAVNYTDIQCISFPNSVCVGTEEKKNIKIYTTDASQTGLVAWWTFDDSLALDTSFNTHSFEPIPAVGPPRRGKGATAHFHGYDHSVITHSTHFETSQISIAFWIYLLQDSVGAWRNIFSKSSNNHQLTPSLQLWPRERRLHARGSTSSGSPIGLDSTGSIPLKRWVHVTLVSEGKLMQLYLNGQLDSQIVTDSPSVWNTNDLVIGGDDLHAGTACYMDDLRIYNIPLGADYISNLAHNAFGPVSPSFAKLGCLSCSLSEAVDVCTNLDDIESNEGAITTYHLCNAKELSSGALTIARVQGWYLSGDDLWTGEDTVDKMISLDKRLSICCNNEI